MGRRFLFCFFLAIHGHHQYNSSIKTPKSRLLNQELLSPQVNGFDVTDVPQHVFFDLLREADEVAKIQFLKIPVSKV